jgi:hypothetical protein
MKLTVAFLLSVSSAINSKAQSTSAPIVDLGYASYQGSFDASTNVTNFFGLRYASPPLGAIICHCWRLDPFPYDYNKHLQMIFVSKPLSYQLMSLESNKQIHNLPNVFKPQVVFPPQVRLSRTRRC